MKKILIFIVLLLVIAFFGTAMVIGIYEGITGKNVISESSNSITIETTTDNNTSASSKATSIKSSTTTTLTQKTLNAPIQFSVLGYDQDYVGGNSVKVRIKNTSEKDIKYVYYTLSFYNSVGDPICDTIRGWYTMRWEVVGPIKPGHTTDFYGGIFYNQQFQGQYGITQFEIVYMDNSKITISASDFSKYNELLE